MKWLRTSVCETQITCVLYTLSLWLSGRALRLDDLGGNPGSAVPLWSCNFTSLIAVNLVRLHEDNSAFLMGFLEC